MIATPPRPATSDALADVRLVAAEMGKREAKGMAWIKSHPVTVKWVECKSDSCPTCDMQAACQYQLPVSLAALDSRPNPNLILPSHWQGTVKDASAMVRLYAHIRAVQRASMRVQMLDQLITRAEAKHQDNEESAELIREMAAAWGRYETARAALEMVEGEMGR